MGPASAGHGMANRRIAFTWDQPAEGGRQTSGGSNEAAAAASAANDGMAIIPMTEAATTAAIFDFMTLPFSEFKWLCTLVQCTERILKFST